MAHLPPISPLQPWLAPLAGYSNLPFRLLCRAHGCAVAVTEMISAKGLLLGSSNTAALLATCPEDQPLGVQLFGAEPEVLSTATAQLRAQGFVWFDLNAGCAVPKVTRTGAGAALLRDPGRLTAVAEAMVAAAGQGAVGVKLRLGWSENHHTYLEIARRLETVGVGWLTLHPRTASQGFSGTARWEHLYALKHSVGLPVLASGDLFVAEDGVRCLEMTGVDAVMFARGAMGDPSIFERFIALLCGTPSPPRDLGFIRKLIAHLGALHHQWGSPRQGLLQLRTLAPRFFRGMPQARAIRTRLIHCFTWEEALACIADVTEAP